MRGRLEVAAFRGLSHGSAFGKAGFGGGRKLHGAEGLGDAFLLFTELILMLGELTVQGNGLSCKESQLFRAAVPVGGGGKFQLRP